jgi:hypothetical protein
MIERLRNGVMLGCLIGLLLWPTSGFSDDLLYSAGLPTDGKAPVARYYEGNLSGLHHYLADLAAMNPQAAASLHPAWEDLQLREDQAVAAGALQGGFGGALLIGSISFLREKVSNGSGGVQYQMSGSAAVLGVVFVAAAFAVYDILAPSRADILSFINLHNETLPANPLQYRLGPNLPVGDTPQPTGLVVPF